MKRAITIFLTGVGLFFLTGIVSAQDMIIYPAKGQSQEQLDKDKYECYSWAKKQTGFDPMQMPTASTPPPQQEPRRGGLGRGSARGAAAGAAIGSLDGEMGKGAAAGAIAGGVIGGIRRREQLATQQQKEQQWAQQQATQYAGSRNEYNRAYAACLEGRGYTVK
ncbi:hypothetical protein D3OALGA1CA_3841 [Olavius algarvensis associated proteobacterium Delta 3]|nr:hypothetical protein D3OALGB2SA_3318 [Olavius algarvensis associated proteobacterium Delta 3]CAB5140782.1 hypothetical protein D3OALGA1CA_3841 [Olavius algarvensis associated proteobacterium Delta 3]